MAAGTLYGGIENLLKQKWLQPVGSLDNRRKVYVITDQGREMLRLNYERMRHMIDITEIRMGLGTGSKPRDNI
ncbi:hypothetical protein FPZ45_20185 [Cohnella terricola]|uniref:Transcription regulator PadR N-terminal domain-containing protein n=1 Tax=Cohnella terricola TaxID=1289167 RepID=A0A559JAM6_9BACL|nr:hypothetical protein FPZ45_20185 [Cohnella terricola]